MPRAPPPVGQGVLRAHVPLTRSAPAVLPRAVTVPCSGGHSLLDYPVQKVASPHSRRPELTFPLPVEAPSQVPTPSRPSQVCVCEEAQVQSGQAADQSDKARNCTGARLSPSWAFPAAAGHCVVACVHHPHCP